MESSRSILSRLRFTAAMFAALMLPMHGYAGLIRDAEIENTLAAYSYPIFDAAGITPTSVRIFVVADPQINAYVAGGLNIFLNTGLIRHAKKPGMLIGVIAHETGHIAGAHLSQFSEKSSRATIGGILGALAGAAVIASGGGSAGAGIIAGSQNAVGKSFLSEIRLNESSADQASLTYLDANDISATGALEMFQTLKQYESGLASSDPFMSNHPLTSERITAMRDHIRESSIPAGQVPPEFIAMHARMLAKLRGFMDTYDSVLVAYPLSDTSVAARYARAIAEFKRSNFDEALKGMDSLIKEHPEDPFFYDTRGQILFESGKVDAAVASYAKAAALMPGSALILTDYAKAIITSNKPKDLNHAILLLERSKDLDDSYDLTWRQLAIAYGKQGRLGMSYEALAEEAALRGDYRTVIQHVIRARGEAKNDPVLALALDDLESDAKAQLKRKKDANSLF